MSKVKKFLVDHKSTIAIATLSVATLGLAVYAANRSMLLFEYRDAYDKLFVVIRDLGGDPDELLETQYIEQIVKNITS